MSIMAYRDVQNSVDTARNEGEEKGIKKGKAEAMVNLMESMKLTMEQALKALKIPESEWDEYRASVAQREVPKVE